MRSITIGLLKSSARGLEAGCRSLSIAEISYGGTSAFVSSSLAGEPKDHSTHLPQHVSRRHFDRVHEGAREGDHPPQFYRIRRVPGRAREGALARLGGTIDDEARRAMPS